MRKIVLGIPVHASGKNITRPSMPRRLRRPASFDPIHQEIGKLFRTDLTPFAMPCMFPSFAILAATSGNAPGARATEDYSPSFRSSCRVANDILGYLSLVIT